MSTLYKYDIEKLRGVGESRGKLFRKLGIATAGDLLRFYPRDYENWSEPQTIASTVLNEINVIRAKVVHTPTEHRIRNSMVLYKVTVTDDVSDLYITFFNNRYITKMLKEGEEYLFRGKVTGNFTKREMTSPVFMRTSSKTPIVPIYRQTQGLSSKLISNAVKEALRLLPSEINDPLPASIRKKYELCHINFALKNIHFPKAMEDIEIAKHRLVFEEFLILQIGLLQIKSGNTLENLHKIQNDYSEEYASLLSFKLTNAQKRAITQAIDDMKSDTTMNRLIQGDVGSGKTAVAASLCYTAAKNGMQSALMAPTEILASQHFMSLTETLQDTDIKLELLTGSTPAAKKREIKAALAEGQIDLIIGTHALISQDVNFRNLGLVITDEQHRFGVGQRSALSEKGNSPHLLVMSATPIPRTLALMVYGDLDISILDELPPGRQKIETYLIDSSKRRRAFRYIQKHLDQGRQGYLICPAVEESQSEIASVTEYSEIVRKSFPDATVEILHGKLSGKEKDKRMTDFADGKIDLLVATTVVEVGVDVPNAAIMLIENAERYGLSQLHQLRGRIGRGKYKSTCILLSDAENPETVERLKVMCETSDGFKIADADLKLRGPGDFFGQRQHGLPQLKIADMMTDMPVLIKAQECAREIYSTGEIKGDEFKSLRAEIKVMFYKSGNSVISSI